MFLDLCSVRGKCIKNTPQGSLSFSLILIKQERKNLLMHDAQLAFLQIFYYGSFQKNIWQKMSSKGTLLHSYKQETFFHFTFATISLLWWKSG